MSTAAPSPAVIAAQQAQDRLDQCLEAGNNFRLEAGAGAGKTYSLVAALRKLIAERGTVLMNAGQRVACITYTEVARNEIAQEIEQHPAILVNTIHGFGWSFISRFQKQLRELVAAQESRREAIEAAGGIHNQTVEYSLGYFGIDDKRITLHHDDVPKFLAVLLANPKFQRIFSSLHPFLFIDEYQDTDPLVMSALSDNFFATGTGPIIGLFGDHWQTIYRKDYHLAEFPNVEPIDKGSNFRSVPVIVDVLNKLRPELIQQVDDETAEGEARFFHCNAYTGERVDSRNGKQELPAEMSVQFIDSLKTRLRAEGWDLAPPKTKILMLTHNAIAAERGYPNLADIFDHKEAFSKKEDATIAYLADTVEPICQAYIDGNYGEMFRLMGGLPTIRKSADKTEWRAQMDQLVALRAGSTIGEMIELLKSTKRPRLADRVAKREADIAELGPEETDDEPNSLKRHRQLRTVAYRELVALVEFINGFTPFATQHSVKGAEFENVLVILSGGWNHYNWPKFLDYLHTGNVNAKEQASFSRWRNLFYVAISRPKRRLAVLATQTLGSQALAAAAHLFGDEGVVSLPVPQA
ncbi:UvrD-helicase domain-containing protein [Rhizobium leguminosarum]|uniref:UvrD-helicase domain-containing protein n=1 Tax=Rhizobium leguminosarum TaxID=384 RepID=UPI001C9620C2|nr:UvrD-helicase domain-containing protein [Rhizobium leguminosarum]MBY5579475.1 ATP-dependent helicase [Rhizobium leguminosarum]MBY5611852.1 ATP-dependent helicase [Rhizobium leguminosarum]MBY5642601.1 ATP-dependent helicase [Rhizobium leguminosarum]MBY5658121.1 ATP-dependent helicase [Rhizobium leguminosarum]